MVRKEMKDLTTHFCDSMISRDNSDIELEEVINQVINSSGAKNNFKRTNTRKRGRIKIKIHQSNSCSRMCDIEDCENEFDGKISSSFDIPPDKAEFSAMNNILEESIESSCGENEHEQISNDPMELDSTNESIFSVDIRRNKHKISPISNEVRINEREESNAFQVLMTRTKPLRLLGSKQLTPEEAILTAKNRPELKSKTKQNENKLITPMEKKNCTKRKLTDKEDEPEEEEGKTAKRLGNRAKIFKKTNSSEFVESISPDSNRKVLVNGLHNYFNKITPEEREKERLLAVSTMVVKADIHGSESIACAQPLVPKSNNNGMKLRRRRVFTSIDDIQILRSESPPLIETIQLQRTPEKRSQSQHKKPKWSLRINFQSHEQDSDIIDGDILDKQKTKLNNWVTSKQKETKKEVYLNKKLPKPEKRQQCDEIVDFNVDNIDIDTDNAAFVSNNKVNGVVKADFELYDRGLENNDNNSIIEVIEVKKSSNDKLAPLFTKRLKPDPKVIAARHSFLHSRSPESEKKKSQRKALLPAVPMLPFPLVSHVTQLDLNPKSDTSSYNSVSRVKEQSNYIPTVDSNNLKHVNRSTDTARKQPIAAEQAEKVNIETALRQIEQRCADAPEMWKTISSIMNKGRQRLTPKKRGPKRKSIDKKTNQVDYRNNVHIDTWTQKYRPLSTKEVVGNEEAATKLRNWLKTWKLSTSKEDYSSGDEFQCSDNSSNDLSQNNQVAVLLGPHGSGKTASVYAIAEELGYTVLEVNASSKRSGRKILKELEEATKSHRVKNTDSRTLTQHTLSNNKNAPEDSLILIEDVDLIFDEDDGFISAIYQLSSNTKRPIVMTCRESCLHLSRMAPQQLQIYFQIISGSRAMALIELIALAETGFAIPRPCLEKLLVNGDLRKALLKLQYLLLSGVPHATELSCSFHKTLWQDTRSYLYKPNVQVTKKRIKEKNNRDNSQKTRATGLVNLADDLETVSLISSLIDINESILNVSRVKFEPAVSLEENVDLYSSNSVRSHEISEWLRCEVMNKYIEVRDEIDISSLNELTIKKKINMSVNRALSQVSMHTLDTRILSTDYLSTVRTICRAEDMKGRNNFKRGNRFFHYLQNLRIPSASIKPNILAAACKIMQERPEIVPKP